MPHPCRVADVDVRPLTDQLRHGWVQRVMRPAYWTGRHAREYRPLISPAPGWQRRPPGSRRVSPRRRTCRSHRARQCRDSRPAPSARGGSPVRRGLERVSPQPWMLGTTRARLRAVTNRSSASDRLESSGCTGVAFSSVAKGVTTDLGCTATGTTPARPGRLVSTDIRRWLAPGRQRHLEVHRRAGHLDQRWMNERVWQ